MGKAAPCHPLGQATFDSQAWHCLDGADRGFLGLLFADPETPKSIHKDGALAEAHYNVTTTNLINSSPLSSTQTDTSETQIMSNSTEIECTYATCSVKEDGMLEYIPTLPGNAAYAGVFVALLVLHIFFGVKFRTWSFLVGMTCGNILEVAGYGGRILLHHNVFEKNYFIINLVGLTIGPAFLSASIYLCLARIIYIFGEKLSLLRPRVITYIFMACDSVSLVLQSAGGAITSMADDEASNQRGVDIMIAGLWSQVASLSIFMLLCAHFAWCTVRNPHKINGETIVLRSTVKFKCFLIVATITIQIRSAFRLAELQDGFDGKLANNELLFMIFEGPMIIIAVAGLTIFHPGLVIGRDMWKAAKGKKAKDIKGPYKEVADDEDSIPMMPPDTHSRMQSYSHLGTPEPYGNGGIRGSRDQL
ncbi:hypothetical protein PV05_00295 [Exophiala xenobiotica]|uniref:RTA1 domain protein n=1 Tax=Exophiala xenobiotica TaxID=348802 RepID=A0A0D2EZG2_9EURO|nr:uncharacterized protein PV05_00295 [Exophiala xenobiotica]KIW60045.1 hypothetical protein PV05_00295 [Exophiala xenobiotica]